jgi:hypothetical protein
MDNRFDDPLALDPLSPPPFCDPRWFIPAHGVGGSPTTILSVGQTIPAHDAAELCAELREHAR